MPDMRNKMVALRSFRVGWSIALTASNENKLSDGDRERGWKT